MSQLPSAPPGHGHPDAPERPQLPFTVIDESVHLLDTPAEPWTIQFELGVEGWLSEERLRPAVLETLSRHPMALARQRPARQTDKTWQWEITSDPDVDPLRTVDCRDDCDIAAVRAEFYSVPVPLAESPPLRLRLVRRTDGDLLMLNANHAAFDGFGCLRLLRSIAAAYKGEDDPKPAVDLAEARDVLGILEARDPTTRANRWRALLSKASDLARKPSTVAADSGHDLPGYGFHSFVLSEQDTKALDEAPGDATVNDLLVAALHLAVQNWNAEHGASAGRISTLLPVNLRPKEWRDDIVTNFVLDTRIATGRSDRSSAKAVVEAVIAQSKRVKEGGGAALIEVLGGATALPLWAKQPLSPLLWVTGNRLVDSALISNMGELKDVPSFGPDAADTTEAWFSAPCRMPCAVSVGAVSVGGRLHLTFRYRHPAWGRTAARRFGDIFQAELKEVAQV